MRCGEEAALSAALLTHIWIVSSPAETGVAPKLMNKAIAIATRLTVTKRILSEHDAPPKSDGQITHAVAVVARWATFEPTSLRTERL